MSSLYSLRSREPRRLSPPRRASILEGSPGSVLQWGRSRRRSWSSVRLWLPVLLTGSTLGAGAGSEPHHVQRDVEAEVPLLLVGALRERQHVLHDPGVLAGPQQAAGALRLQRRAE